MSKKKPNKKKTGVEKPKTSERRASQVGRLAHAFGVEDDKNIVTGAVWMEPRRVPLKILAFLLVSGGAGVLLGAFGLLLQVNGISDPNPGYDSVLAMESGQVWTLLGGVGLAGLVLIVAGYGMLAWSVRDPKRPELRLRLYDQFFRVRWQPLQLLVLLILLSGFAAIAWSLKGRVEGYLNPPRSDWVEARMAIAEEYRPLFEDGREMPDADDFSGPILCAEVDAIFPEPWEIRKDYKERRLLWRTSEFFYSVKYIVRCTDDGELNYVIDEGAE